MRRIYSKCNPDKLLFVLNRREDINEKRLDLIPPQEYLQLATKSLKNHDIAKAHEHNEINRETHKTQEAWVVLQGRLAVTFYDLDETVVLKTQLQSGDCIVLLHGGHSFEVLEDDTFLYEFKTGPFLDIEKDKRFIKR